VSPILVRPVREQLEHDRVIRLLQAKYKRKFEVAINPGHEQTMPVGTGPSPWYPDLVLQSGKKIAGTVEVETAESVNHLEAMSQWATFSRLRTPFHLYVPSSSIDTAKRLCTDLQISVSEMWAYSALGDQMRFTLVQRSSDGKARSAAPAARPSAPAPRRPAATPARRTASARPARRPAAATRPRASGAKKSKAAARGTAKKTSGSRAQKRK
jgi:hypothetical protein